MEEKVPNAKDPMHLGPNRDLHLLHQRVVFEPTAVGIRFSADSVRALVRCLQKAGCSFLKSPVGIIGSTTALVAQSLVWEGLDDGGTQDPAVSRKRKNGEPLLDLRDWVLLAGFGQDLEKAQAAEAAAAVAPAGDRVPAGPKITALAQAAGYGDWPHKILPDGAMIMAP